MYSVDLRCFESGHVQSTEDCEVHTCRLALCQTTAVLYWLQDKQRRHKPRNHDFAGFHDIINTYGLLRLQNAEKRQICHFLLKPKC